MTYDAFLICLNRGGVPVVEAIKTLWPQNRHLHITGEDLSGPLPEGTAQILAVAAERKNGPTLSNDIYRELKEEVGTDFASIIVPVESTLYGFNRAALWEWLSKVTS